jgi:hypothetical protein
MTGSPLRIAFATLVNADTAAALEAAPLGGVDEGRLLARLVEHARPLGVAAWDMIGEPHTSTPPDAFVADLASGVGTAIGIARDAGSAALGPASRDMWLALLAWLASRGFGGGPGVTDRGRRCRDRLYRWGVDDVSRDAFRAVGLDGEMAERAVAAVAAIHVLPMWRPGGVGTAGAVLASWVADRDADRALGERAAGTDGHFAESRFSWFVALTSFVAAVRLIEYPIAYGPQAEPILDWVTRIATDLRMAATASDPRNRPAG